MALSDELEALACGNCGGTGWMVRDPDIGTDQECFVCDGSGRYSESATPQPTKAREIERLRQDAMRYRWLREHRSIDLHANPSVPWVVRCEFQPIPTTTAIVGEALDAAIDTARKQGETNEH